VTVLRPAGDRGVLVDLPDGVAPAAAAAAVRERLGAAVQDVVPGHRTVLVTWASAAARPARTELERLLAFGDLPAAPAASAAVELAVRYDGPDLEAVARHAGLTPDEVVARHLAARYEVAFVGFLPGFAYLVGGDPALAVPRRADPRPRVPAGSVALAGPYSAVYPSASPGGWQLVGTCAAMLFDPRRDPPAVLAAGTRVRFVAA
jgi:KipI family sensor histidine kinase inhibitor